MDSRLLTTEEKTNLDLNPRWTVKEIRVDSKVYYYLKGPYKSQRWIGGFQSLDQVRNYIEEGGSGRSALKLGFPFEIRQDTKKDRGMMNPFLARIVFPSSEVSEKGDVILAHEIGHYRDYRQNPEHYMGGWLPRSEYHESSEKEAWEFAISKRLPKGLWGSRERQIAQESLEAHLCKKRREDISDWIEETEEKFGDIH